MEKCSRQTIINEALEEFLHVMMWRRNIHRHPELSFEEKRTSKFIAEVLEQNGISYERIAGTGILARIEGVGSIRNAVVLRADIDALPVAEDAGCEFASVNAGVMHACGHDMHTAILLGALRVLNRHRGEFNGTLFGLFQPGEELNPGGASMVLKEDPFKDYNVLAVVGEHVEPSMQTGSFGFRKGKYMASSDELRFTVNGIGGHAAVRDKIKDPVQAAAELVGRLYEIPGMNPDEGLPTILSIGKVIAAGATNVVPDSVYMEGTMRTFDEQWRKQIKTLVREFAAGVDEKYGVSTNVDISDGYPSVYNDEALADRVVEATRELFGKDAVAELGLRTTADDFGYFSERYPSVYYRLGVGGSGEFFEKGEAGRVHTPTFCPDEKALGYGVMQFVNVALTILG